MNTYDLEELMYQKSLEDLWWVAIDQVVLDAQITLAELRKRMTARPEANFSALNVAFTDNQELAWIELETGTTLSSSSKKSEPDNATLLREIRSIRTHVQSLENAIRIIQNHYLDVESLDAKEQELREREHFVEQQEDVLLRDVHASEARNRRFLGRSY